LSHKNHQKRKIGVKYNYRVQGRHKNSKKAQQDRLQKWGYKWTFFKCRSSGGSSSICKWYERSMQRIQICQSIKTYPILEWVVSNHLKKHKEIITLQILIILWEHTFRFLGRPHPIKLFLSKSVRIFAVDLSPILV
jgi:hypothetical protein